MDSPSPDSSKPDEVLSDDRESGVTLTLAVTVSYKRLRGRIHDRFEARMDSALLILAGAAIVVLLLWLIVPRVLQWFGDIWARL